MHPAKPFKHTPRPAFPSPKRCYLPGAAVDSRGSSEGAPLTLTWVKDTGTRSCAGAKHPYCSDCIPSVSAKGMARAGNFPAAGTARVVHRYSVVRSVVLDVRTWKHGIPYLKKALPDGLLIGPPPGKLNLLWRLCLLERQRNRRDKRKSTKSTKTKCGHEEK